MQKYRLQWTGDGALDLSQVLDECGIPVVFPNTQATVIVDAATFRHPLVQNYLKVGLKADKLGSIIGVFQPPLTPALTKPKAPSPSVAERVEEEHTQLEEPPKQPDVPEETTVELGESPNEAKESEEITSETTEDETEETSSAETDESNTGVSASVENNSERRGRYE